MLRSHRFIRILENFSGWSQHFLFMFIVAQDFKMYVFKQEDSQTDLRKASKWNSSVKTVSKMRNELKHSIVQCSLFDIIRIKELIDKESHTSTKNVKDDTINPKIYFYSQHPTYKKPIK